MPTQAEVDAAMAGMPWLTDPELFMGPEEQWQTYIAKQSPFWQRRAPAYDIMGGLRARHLMAMPGMPQTGETPGTFGQFLRDWRGGPGYLQGEDMPAYGARTMEDLRSRAYEVSAAARPLEGTGAYLATGLAEGSEEDPLSEFRRRAWYNQQFGSEAENAQRNMQAVANLLAVQRQGGGQYAGGMADAIRRAMGQLQQHHVREGGPRESFLNWYLEQTKPPATPAAT